MWHTYCTLATGSETEMTQYTGVSWPLLKQKKFPCSRKVWRKPPVRDFISLMLNPWLTRSPVELTSTKDWGTMQSCLSCFNASKNLGRKGMNVVEREEIRRRVANENQNDTSKIRVNLDVEIMPLYTYTTARKKRWKKEEIKKWAKEETNGEREKETLILKKKKNNRMYKVV